jgi:aminomethyltransferase
MVRDIRRLKPLQVTYTCWCDGYGKIVDDGTIIRFEDDSFRVIANVPTYEWLDRHSRGFDVKIVDTSRTLGMLALQGPFSREILKGVVSGVDMDKLRFFRGGRGKIGGSDVLVTRTGYTGDLGYEIWAENANCLKLWDALIEGGRPRGLLPAGLSALDMTRVEAGFILPDVDYFSSRDCIIESRKSTPYELDLGWTVNLDREPFIGQEALKRERKEGPAWSFVGLEVDWPEFEALYERYGLPPQVPASAWRTAVPVYADEQHVGRATSGTWSPILKKNLALATVRSEYAAVGTELQIEVTVEYVRHPITARVVKKPFFDPPRKRSTPGLPTKKASASSRPIQSTSTGVVAAQ